MDINKTLLEIKSLNKDIDEIVREKIGLNLDSFLDPEISRSLFEKTLKRIYSNVGLEHLDLDKLDDFDRIMTFHLMMIFINLLEDQSIKEKIIEKEINKISQTLQKLLERKEIKTIIELAKSLDIEASLIEKPQIIYIAIDDRYRTRVIVNEVKIDFLNFVNIIKILKTQNVEKYDLMNLSVSKGYVYMPLYSDNDYPSLYSLLTDLVKIKIKDKIKRYSYLIETLVLEDYRKRLKELEEKVRGVKKDLYIRSMVKIVKKIESLEVSEREDLFPKCIKNIIEKIKNYEEFRPEELYLLTVFLAYAKISEENISKIFGENHKHLNLIKNIVKRINEHKNREIYYPIPSCSYIKNVLKIVDEECEYKNPLRHYLRLLHKELEKSYDEEET
jgi:DNA primase large subunit